MKEKTRNTLAALSVAFTLACGEGLDPNAPTAVPGCVITVTGNGNSSSCGNSTQTNQATPSPSATPAQVTDCRVDWIRRGGPDFLPAGGEATFSITPMQTFKDAQGATQEVEVSAPCNNAKPSPVWAVSDPRIASVAPFGTGFEAKVKRLATGNFTLTATFDGKAPVTWTVQGFINDLPPIKWCVQAPCPQPFPTPSPAATPRKRG